MEINGSLTQALLERHETPRRPAPSGEAGNLSIRQDVLIPPLSSGPGTRPLPTDILDIRALPPALPPENDPGDVATSELRSMTPRSMTEYSMDLYLTGELSFEEYSMLAFQPELHPDYEKTIGALTGERAQPDRPRDYIAQWEDRLDFEQRYPSATGKLEEQVERIVNVLRAQEDQTGGFA